MSGAEAVTAAMLDTDPGIRALDETEIDAYAGAWRRTAVRRAVDGWPIRGACTSRGAVHRRRLCTARTASSCVDCWPEQVAWNDILREERSTPRVPVCAGCGRDDAVERSWVELVGQQMLVHRVDVHVLRE